MKKRLIFIVSVLSLLLLSSCRLKEGSLDLKGEEDKKGLGAKEGVSREIFAMDTYMTLTAYGENAKEGLEEAIEEIRSLDANLSTGLASSEIARLNADKRAKVGEDALYLIKRSMEIHRTTDLFDISVYPIMRLWGFTDGNFQVPSKEQIGECLKAVDSDKILLEEKTGEVSFADEKMAIDLGAIAKGYTSHKVIEILKEKGITSAIVNLGGNVEVLGSKPDKSPWKVAIQDPVNKEGFLGVLTCEDKAVITSGGYERYFEKEGKRYHHIIDIRTGYPAESGLSSVTIVSSDGTLADALSTSLFIMGQEGAKAYWKAHKSQFEAVFYKEDGSIDITEGLEKSFRSDYPVNIIR